MSDVQPQKNLPGGSGSAVASAAPCIKFEVEFLNVKKNSEMYSDGAVIAHIEKKELAKSKFALLKDARQYVNLPKEEKWRKEAEAHLDRLGRKPRIAVRFAAKEVRQVEVRIAYTASPVCDARNSDNVAYTSNELGRAAGSAENLGPRIYSTDSNGIVVVDDMEINAAGGNRYRVEAKDVASGVVKYSSATIQTWRIFWLQALRYANLKNKIDYSAIAKRYRSVYIEINTKRHKPLSSKNLEILVDDDCAAYWAEVDALLGRTARQTAPYTIPLALIRFNCARTGQLYLPSTVMPASKQKLKMTCFPPVYSKDRFATKSWLNTATFFPADGRGAVDITAACDVKKCGDSSLAAIIIIDRGKFPTLYQGRQEGRVEISIAEVPVKEFAGDRDVVRNCCSVSMERPCRIAKDQMRMNRSRDAVDAGPLASCVHEIGHFMNMVTDGSGTLPENRGNHYRNDATPGNHCLPTPLPAVVAGTHCVMYGIGVPEQQESFCSNCEIELRKMDLSCGKNI